ncbi:MAG: SIS domain-containing protein [Armatimonadetes bacterium]|nr:SIS domain-containing protein [Armatimonadota bacterium]
MTAEESAEILNNLTAMQEVDRKNMLRLISELPEQCETALGIGRSFGMQPVAVKPNVVLFVGVGDSGLAADMVCHALAEEAEVPILSQHVSTMPMCVGDESLVFVIDHSGRSQTALRALKAAQDRGAKVVCLTAGAKIRALAPDPKLVLSVPSGQPSRSAIGYLMLTPLAVIERIGLAMGAIEKASHAIKLMKNTREFLRADTPLERNPAKQIARTLFGKTPVIYGAAGYRALVLARWKSQIGANGKSPACKGVFPDLADGEICAWENVDGKACNPTFVFLTDPSDKTNENLAVMQAASELLDKFGVLQVEMKGSTTIEKMLYGVYLGDYVSYYLAILRGVDPTEVASVRFINDRLAPFDAPRSAASSEHDLDAGNE